MSDVLLVQFQCLLEEIRTLRDLQGLPTILTKKRAARELGVSLSKLKGLMRRGELAVCEVGRTTMIPASEVTRIADAKRFLTEPTGARSSSTRTRRGAPRGEPTEAQKIRAALKKPR